MDLKNLKNKKSIAALLVALQLLPNGKSETAKKVDTKVPIDQKALTQTLKAENKTNVREKNDNEVKTEFKSTGSIQRNYPNKTNDFNCYYLFSYIFFKYLDLFICCTINNHNIFYKTKKTSPWFPIQHAVLGDPSLGFQYRLCTEAMGI